MSKYIYTNFDNYIKEEFLGFSKQEKQLKELKDDIKKSKLEIESFDFNNLFKQPSIVNNSNTDLQTLINYTITDAKYKLPTLFKVFPFLFELDKKSSNACHANMIFNNKILHGIIPDKWEFVLDTNDIINNEKAKNYLIDKLNYLILKKNTQ